ncbi:hypothetical protein F5882DRAFT_467834 [Hyaloscypha sp. PMI_1271]|nr:hypothetical protein F5882DRAFT_467834 [Hyaloscypha sp. PMI_1271]
MERGGGLRDYYFCFFIDSLDEFDDPDTHQAMLAEKLRTWTDRNLNSLKIYVSSREENAFLNEFTQSQRLPLHLLTQNDIIKMTKSSLDSHRRFRESTSQDQEDLIHRIVTQAQGVFLWVALVLNEIHKELNSLLPGRPLQILLDLLETIPEDLAEFLGQILRSISKRNREEAWTILTIAIATNDLDYAERFSILHYSFVGDLCKNKHLGQRQPMCDASVAEITSRVEGMRYRLKGLCGGLVETTVVRERRYVTLADPSYWAFRETIVFTHRSIYEFLRQEAPHDFKTFFGDLDVLSFHLQLLILQMKLIPFDSEVVRCYSSNLLRNMFERFPEFNHADEHIYQLGSLEYALLQRQYRTSNPVKEFDWSAYITFLIPTAINQGSKPRELISVLGYSCYFGNMRYVAWSMINRPTLTLDNRSRANLLSCNLEAIHHGHTGGNRVEVLRYLLEHGFNPELASGDSTLTIWEEFVQTFINSVQNQRVDSIILSVLEIFLNSEVDPHFRFSGWNLSRNDGHFDYPYEQDDDFGYSYEQGDDSYFSSKQDLELIVSRGLPPNSRQYKWNCPKSLEWPRERPELSLREIVEILEPENKTIPALIDRNLALYEKRARLAMAVESGIPPQPVGSVDEEEEREAERSKKHGL